MDYLIRDGMSGSPLNSAAAEAWTTAPGKFNLMLAIILLIIEAISFSFPFN